MFHIVSFLETNEVEVVPSGWVDDNYDDARKKLPEAELFSDIQSVTESGAKKPRRIMKSFRLQNFKLLSDDDDDNEGQNLKGLEPTPRIKPPAFQTFSQSTQNPSSGRQQPPLCQTCSQPPASDQFPFYLPASQPPVCDLSPLYQPASQRPASDQSPFYKPASQAPACDLSSIYQPASQPLPNHQQYLFQPNSQSSLDYLQPAGSESGIRRNQPLQSMLYNCATLKITQVYYS
ncbi:uncharacterized protein LOC120461757 [Tachysurus ichikawai]